METEFGGPGIAEDGALIPYHWTGTAREDRTDGLLSTAAGYQACNAVHWPGIEPPLTLLPVLPDPLSPAAKFRRSGRAYTEAASVEFAGGVILSPRYSKETALTAASASPQVTPRLTDAHLSPRFEVRFLEGRRLRRGRRTLIDDEGPDVPDGRMRRSCVDVDRVISPTMDRRSLRFRSLGQQII